VPARAAVTFHQEKAMRSLCKFGLVLGLAALVATPALAQRPGGGGGRGFQMSVSQLFGMVAQNEDLAKELKIDKDQGDKIKDALTKFRDDHKDDYAKLRDMNTKQEDRDALRKTLSEGTEKILKDIVKDDQMKRAKQIVIQAKGLQAFTDDDVVKALKLTDEQKDDIKKLSEDTQKDIQDLFKDVGMDMTKRQEAFTKMTSIRKDATEKAVKMLKDDQKKAWKELTGDAFELKFNFGRPGGGAGGTGTRPNRPNRPNPNPNP
jgi:hypothetical protein